MEQGAGTQSLSYEDIGLDFGTDTDTEPDTDTTNAHNTTSLYLDILFVIMLHCYT